MATTAALWAALSLALWSGKWDGRLLVTGEVRAGEAPLAASESPRPGVAALIVPGALIRWWDRDLQLQLDYGARVFWRHPNELGNDRPLLLHLAHLTLLSRPAAHVQLTGQGQASVGEADYSALPTIFSGPQGTLPSVLKVVSLSAGLGFAWDPARRWRVELSGEAEHRDTLGDAPVATDPNGNPVPGFTLPKQTTLRQMTAVGARPSVTDLVGLALLTAYATYDSYPVVGVSLLTMSPQAYWRRWLSRQTEARLALGISVSRRWGEPIGATVMQGPWTTSPSFGLLVESHLLRDEGVSWDVGGGVTGEAFLDPVLAVVTPRAVAELHVRWRAPPRWSGGLQGSFVAPMTRTPLPGEPDETAFSLALPLRYRASPHLTWEWGVRWSDRAPHWDASEFRFHQRQVWAYVSVLAETLNLFE